MAGLLIMAAFYSISRQKMYMDACSRELQDSLLQAQEVKCDLQEIMHNTLILSQQIADDLEKRLHPEMKRRESAAPDLLDQKGQTFIYLEPSPTGKGSGEFVEGKMRVHELADELGVSSKELLLTCLHLGYPVRHHMKILNEEQIQRLRDYFFSQQPVVLPDYNPKPLIEDRIRIKTDQERQTLPLEHSVSEQGREFSLDEIKKAHPYIAVRTLCELGYTSKEIARILDRGQGEVNLILNLSRKKIG